MMQDTMSASDDLARRRRTLFDRIMKLSAAGLAEVEARVSMVEQGPAAWRLPSEPLPGAQRVVGGATITERPDLAYAAAAGGTIQAPAPEHPAEMAKVGPAVR